MARFPSSVLFCCDHNAVRSPMAEGLMKRLYGTRSYVQSAGVKSDLEIDGFSIAVCHEIGVELDRHRARTFEELGEDVAGFDLIVALSPAARAAAQTLARETEIEMDYWPINDPTGTGESRETKLDAYRRTRDQIRQHMVDRFGPPNS